MSVFDSSENFFHGGGMAPALAPTVGPRNIFVVGAGAHGRVTLDILRDCGTGAAIRFADDNPSLCGTHVHDVDVAKLEEALASSRDTTAFIVSVGKPSVRLALCERIRSRGHRLANAIHPTAVVASSACIGVGNIVSQHAVINSDARLGDAVVVNTAAIVEHDCAVEDGVSIAPMACVGGRATVARGAFLCIGVRVLPRVRVGAGCVIGSGATVMDDIPDGMFALGFPARAMKRVDESFDWSRVL